MILVEGRIGQEVGGQIRNAVVDVEISFRLQSGNGVRQVEGAAVGVAYAEADAGQLFVLAFKD